MNRLDGLTLNAHTLDDYLKSVAEPIDVVRNGRDAVVARVGKDLYDKLFKGYTRKQSGLDPSELVASVTAHVPTRANRDARSFADTYQAMALHGYTRMFEAMVAHPTIPLMLGTSPVTPDDGSVAVEENPGAALDDPEFSILPKPRP